MVRPDWGALDRPSHVPGIYLAKVAECKEDRSKKNGDLMLRLKLVVEPLGMQESVLCFENLMLEGRGASIGLAKLLALGFEKGADVRAEDVVGRRAWVRVSTEEYDGKQRLKVMTTFNPFECGFWLENEPPDTASESTASIAPDEDVPF